MSQDKASLPHPDGNTFLQHAIDRVASLCDHVCVAGTADQDIEIGAALFLPDPQPHTGPITGVISALQLANERSQNACLVTPVDMPQLSVDDLRKLVSRWRDSGQTTCAVRQTDQHLQPLVAIYSVSLLDSLTQLAASTDRSLYRWVQSQPHQIVQLSDHACHNVNSPSDLSG